MIDIYESLDELMGYHRIIKHLPHFNTSKGNFVLYVKNCLYTVFLLLLWFLAFSIFSSNTYVHYIRD